jgi:phage FluMu protein Com
MKFSKTQNKPDQPKGSAAPLAIPYSPEARCHCGQLVAKVSDNGIELKCKRCKRLILLPFSSLKSGQTTINICENN